MTFTVTDSGGLTQSDDRRVIVNRVNDAMTGDVTISGTPTEDEILTAVSTLDDPDGLGALNYRWLRDGIAISGATDSTYQLQQADVGATISVRVSYVDGGGTTEITTSAATSVVANVNDDPTGGVSITGTPEEGGTLTAVSTLADEDGMGALRYEWQRDGQRIDGAIQASYRLTQDDIGAEIRLRVVYRDDFGVMARVYSAPTSAVTNVNDAPTGGVSISGRAIEGGILRAVSTLADEDGLGALSYRWLRDGEVISGASGTSYRLTQADVGANIQLRVTYRDGFGTLETVSSRATSAVTNVNDAPTGGVSIRGTSTHIGTLSAVSTSLEDEDGLGALTYQWFRDGVRIQGETNAEFELSSEDVGSQIRLRVTYTDGQGTVEQLWSTPTREISFADLSLTGDRGHNRLKGDGGDDLLRGLGGNDTLTGAAGHDTLSGGAGNDRLLGGSGNDSLVGDGGADVLFGNSGSDWLKGGGGSDKLFGHSGNDRLIGQGGRDTLTGSGGHDTLVGGGGHDRIVGGKGNDDLTGGAGRDVFVFSRGHGSDVISDFEIGKDIISIKRGAAQLRGLDFEQVGSDVRITFSNVEVLVENTTVGLLNDADNFLF